MLLKIQNVGKKQKTKKKKNLKTTTPCTITPSPRPLWPCPGLWSSLRPAPRRGEETRGWGGPGDLPLGPPLLSQCRAGWGVRFIYVPLAHSSTYASPPPRPLHVLCLAPSPPAPGPPPAPPAQAAGRWGGWQQGDPVYRLCPPTSREEHPPPHPGRRELPLPSCQQSGRTQAAPL